MSVVPHNTYPVTIDREEFVRNDQLQHYAFYEDTNPDLAVVAWKTHAEGYKGFLNEGAIDNGFLKPGIDTARGSNVRYYLGERFEEDGEAARATMRKKFPLPGEDYTSSPAHRLAGDHLFPEGAAYLEQLKAEGAEIIELGAMAKNEKAHPQDMYEVIRAGIHDSLGRNQVWYCTLVSPTYPSLEKEFGKGNLQIIGEPVTIPDPNVKEGLTLLPVVLEIDKFLPRLLDAYKNAGSQAEQHRLKKSIVRYGSGLNATQMGQELYETRRTIMAEFAAREVIKLEGLKSVG